MNDSSREPSGARVAAPDGISGTEQPQDILTRGFTDRSTPRWMIIGVCVFLAAIVWAVFGQTLRHEFINYDDPSYVYENPKVARGLTSEGAVWAFTQVHSFNWHPVTWISHMLDSQLYGLNPSGHHFTNILLHLTTAVLLFLILERMTGVLWRSAFVSAVFAIHPLRVESVAWVAERKDVLSGLFFMLTIGAYVRYARRPWSPARYGPVVLLFALGLTCKPMLVTLPFVLLLLDYWPLKLIAADTRSRGHFAIPRRRIIDKLPLLGLAAASCGVTLFAQKGAIQSFEQFPLSVRAGNASLSYIIYLRQMFWPSGLALPYPFETRNAAALGVLALISLAGISTAILLLSRRRPYLLTGWLWYLIMLVPVIGILQVGIQARADRYTYLPQIGLYVALAWTAAGLCASWRHRHLLLGAGSALILGALIFAARLQTSHWRDSESLWTHAIVSTLGNDMAHYNLGNALLQKGRISEAVDHYQKALLINPGFADARINLGNALLKKGSTDEAFAYYRQALQIRPDDAIAHYNLGNALLQKGTLDEAMINYKKALLIDPKFADAHNNLGAALSQKGDVDEAIAHYQEALVLNPEFADAHQNLGFALLQKGNMDEAASHFHEVLKIRPDDPAAHYNLANIWVNRGAPDEAIFHYKKALEARPDYAEALNSLAWVLATSARATFRDGNHAVELAERADRLTGGENPIILHTLAAAYAESGRFSEALKCANRAAELARLAGQQILLEHLTDELKLYHERRPLHAGSK